MIDHVDDAIGHPAFAPPPNKGGQHPLEHDVVRRWLSFERSERGRAVCELMPAVPCRLPQHTDDKTIDRSSFRRLV